MREIDRKRRQVEVHLAAAWEIAARTNPMLLTKLHSAVLGRLREEIQQNLDRLSTDELRQNIIDQLFAAASSSQQEHFNETKPSRE